MDCEVSTRYQLPGCCYMIRFVCFRYDQFLFFASGNRVMELKAALLKAHSRQQAEYIAGWIGSDPDRFSALITLFLHDEYRVVQRAAWAINIAGERCPELLPPHLASLITRMTVPGIPAAVKRNIVRLLQTIPIPEALHGQVIHCCFCFLEDEKETVAVRAFSMTVLARLAVVYPDIINDIRLLINHALEKPATPGFRSRAGKTLQTLDRLDGSSSR